MATGYALANLDAGFPFAVFPEVSDAQAVYLVRPALRPIRPGNPRVVR
jgi:hypothetical protein